MGLLETGNWASQAFGVLADSSLKALVLLLLAAGVSTLGLRSRPQLRALVWVVALLGAGLLPVAQQLLPPLPIALLPPLPSAPALAIAGGARTAVLPAVLNSLTAGPGQAATVAADAGWAAGQSWTFWVLVVWAGGVVVVLAWQLIGIVAIAGLTRRGRSGPRMGWLARRLGLQRRRVALVMSDEIAVPVTWGAWQPRVLLPSHAAA